MIFKKYEVGKNIVIVMVLLHVPGIYNRHKVYSKFIISVWNIYL